MKSLGIIGFGSFGRFLARHLRPFFAVSVYDRDSSLATSCDGVEWCSFDEVAASETLVLAVPVQDLEGVVRRLAAVERRPRAVIDVSSVKVKPCALMETWLPPEVEILGTHPMFGPQSGRDGIAGLKVVLCPLSRQGSARAVGSGGMELADRVERFLTDELELRVLRKTPENHDREMAYIQGLTHWIAKALREITLPDLELATTAYRYLLQIEENLRHDSPALFRTISAENPFAADARRELLERLDAIVPD